MSLSAMTVTKCDGASTVVASKASLFPFWRNLSPGNVPHHRARRASRQTPRQVATMGRPGAQSTTNETLSGGTDRCVENASRRDFAAGPFQPAVTMTSTPARIPTTIRSHFIQPHSNYRRRFRAELRYFIHRPFDLFPVTLFVLSSKQSPLVTSSSLQRWDAAW